MSCFKNLLKNQKIKACNHFSGVPIDVNNPRQDVHLDKTILHNGDSYDIQIPVNGNYNIRSPKGQIPKKLKKEIKKVLGNPKMKDYFINRINDILQDIRAKDKLDKVLEKISDFFGLQIYNSFELVRGGNLIRLCSGNDIIYYICIMNDSFEVGTNLLCVTPPQVTERAKINWGHAIYEEYYKELSNTENREQRKKILERIASGIRGIGKQTIERTLDNFDKDLFFQDQND